MVVTRLRTDGIPLDSILSWETCRAWATTERSESNIRVPWCMMRPCLRYWALPENFWPSMVMSLRPLTWASTPSFCRARATGRQNRCRSRALSAPASMTKVKFRLPRSWYTAPPPDSRRTTRTPCVRTKSALISSAVFWCLPTTMVLSFCQSMKYSRSRGRQSKTYCSSARLK